MKAFRLLVKGRPAEWCDVPVPAPAPGQALVHVRAAGLCRTDLALQAGRHDGAALTPFTLGHEIAGVVVEVGNGVDRSLLDQRVLVSAMYFCGRCDMCARGSHSVCRGIGVAGYGVGVDGGIADYVVADAMHLVPFGSIDHPLAAPLADAAATTYHAVRTMRPILVPGSTAVVFGIGGLGAFALQWLRRQAGVHVVAIDRDDEKLGLAREMGAHEAFADGDAKGRTDQLARQVDVVFDLVGTDDTLANGLAMIRGGGRVVVAGISGGRVQLGWDLLPRNGQFINTRGYDLPDLLDVVRIVEDGGVRVPVQAYPFEAAAQALADLAAGRVAARAVLVRED